MKKIIQTTLIALIALTLFSVSVETVQGSEVDAFSQIERVTRDAGVSADQLLRMINLSEDREIDYQETSPTQRPEVTYRRIPSEFRFNQNLSQGSRGASVRYLQILLNQDPDTRVTHSGLGSPGMETDYFGSLTRNAVVRFQEKYSQEILAPQGLTSGTGNVDHYTRMKLNSLLGDDDTPAPPSDGFLDQMEQIVSALERLQERLDQIERGERVFDPDGEEGELFATRRADIRNVEVRRNQLREVAKYRIEAERSTINVQRIDVYVEEAIQDSMTGFRSDIDEMRLKVDGETIAEREINRNTVDRYDEYIRFSGFNIEIPRGRSKDLTIEVRAADRSTFNRNHYSIGPVEDRAIRGRDGAGLTVYSQADSYRRFYLDRAEDVTLEIEDDDSPEERVVKIEKDRMKEVELLNFDLIAEDSDVDLELLVVEFEIKSGKGNINGYTIEDIFQDAVLYSEDHLLGATSIYGTGATDRVIVEFEMDTEIREGDSENFTVAVDILGMDPKDSEEAERIGTEIRASIHDYENRDIAYSYDLDTYVDLSESLIGKWQALYPTLPEFELIDSDIERDRDRLTADALLLIEMEALGGEITLKDVVVANEQTADGSGNLRGDGWDVVIEVDGSEVYVTDDRYDSWGDEVEIDLNERIRRNDYAEIEIFGYNPDSGWVRLAIDSIKWRDEGGNEFEWTRDYDFIERLRSGRVHISN